ncbi:uncharacterized protein VTP21DRAFT_8696 [Calcarisporiella thermophila]|uniref:uncharacterized protein n=1 Tax=Calcarisporiella thermophila TaxID=911321 RepID=UPI0037445011
MSEKCAEELSPRVACASEGSTASAKKRRQKQKQKQATANQRICPGSTSNSLNCGEKKNISLGSLLSISRNKHWKYISSYHGPWLQLPIELLGSLYVINNDTLHPASDPRALSSPAPPPIDPVIFRNIITIRKLVDEASDLSVRAAQGANFNVLNRGHMSSTRQHRMRELAVNKLALAYRIDEVATSVVTMQSASAIDDVAAKVLQRNPNHLEALYVNFFHEKIPSRMLSQSTSTEVLDRIISASPTTAEFYRTRAVVKCFKEDFLGALRDFKTSLSYVRHRRRLKSTWHREKSSIHRHKDDDDECTGTEGQLYFLRGACMLQYAVSLIDKELQELEGVYRSEGGELRLAVLEKGPGESNRPTLEEYQNALSPCIQRVSALARKSIRNYARFLSFYPSSIDATPLPATQGMNPASSSRESSPKPTLNRQLSQESIEKQAEKRNGKKSDPAAESQQLQSVRSKGVEMEKTRVSNIHSDYGYATYHPLLVETWYAIALNYLLLGDYAACAEWHTRIMQMHECIEGYPVFLPARSMAQADYVEVLDRLKKRLLADADARSQMAASQQNGEAEQIDAERDVIHKLLGELMINEGPSTISTETLLSFNRGYCYQCQQKKHQQQHLADAGVNTKAESKADVPFSNSSVTLAMAKAAGLADMKIDGKMGIGKQREYELEEHYKQRDAKADLSTHGVCPIHGKIIPPASAKQYPLYTQRADTIMTWVWAIVVPQVGLSFNEGENGSAEEEDEEDEEEDEEEEDE